ncbi:FGGY family carbohydrate kinase [Lysinibacillus sp. fls2-241-R2A-57]|uniref:FGGY family carbohydrate kinase n=1 Tax=Lysinibacillus sp. fls2-241-R2A-57 TaxID=3040292 RepID=UPI00255525A0|nr:FGGY family carbohydrate kinase [Lysinibacillus sp. fls2-241-R2A-57]
MLYNIYNLKWNEEICTLLNIPMSMLPEMKNSSEIYIKTAPRIFFTGEILFAGIVGLAPNFWLT